MKAETCSWSCVSSSAEGNSAVMMVALSQDLPLLQP